MKYKVVACIPTKNTGWLLKDTLNHLSTFCHKIIVSDDQSTDDTEDICRNNSSVEYYKRRARNSGDRQGALQRQELLLRAYKHDPDYFLFLDADEMPSPDIVGWINSLGSRHEETNNLWTFPWVHLWNDTDHYRVDSYTAKNGSNIHWDPFTTTYRKGFFARNIPDYELKYDIAQHRVRPSNQPINVPKPWVDVADSPVIIHYGKISEYWNTGQNWKDRAEWDKYEKGANVGSTIQHHTIANAEDTLQLKEVDKKWFWI
jgi:glycosyltransferase involved in cell wall biosynthesis